MAAFAATALIPATVMGQSVVNRSQGYLVENDGATRTVVRNAHGECWRHLDPDSPSVDSSCNPAPVVAVAPPPPPAVIAIAPPPPPAAFQQRKKISFSGDALFAFDKSVLKPEGKVMLDGLVRELDGATYDTIALTGHTDRFGSNAYNQRLSERRAQAVKDYLMSNNVRASSIGAEGKGETQHVTNPRDCLGAKATTSVKACLQPDRRVDVEMVGTTIVVGSR